MEQATQIKWEYCKLIHLIFIEYLLNCCLDLYTSTLWILPFGVWMLICIPWVWCDKLVCPWSKLRFLWRSGVAINLLNTNEQPQKTWQYFHPPNVSGGITKESICGSNPWGILQLLLVYSSNFRVFVLFSFRYVLDQLLIKIEVNWNVKILHLENGFLKHTVVISHSF